MCGGGFSLVQFEHSEQSRELLACEVGCGVNNARHAVNWWVG